jgi:hypothetical protein
VTGVPVGKPSTPPAAAFDVFTPLRRPDQDGIPPATPPTPPAPVGQAGAPYARTYPDFGGSPAGADPGNFAGNGEGGNNDLGDGGYQSGDSTAGEDYKGLPRRVRQANLAPQLRASGAASPTGQASVPPATAASLTDMRNTLSAMQRGWQQGRSQSQQDTEDRADGE